MKIEKVCGECKSTYFVKPSQVGRSKFCSRVCLKKHGSIDKICACCGNVFNVPRRRHEQLKFCSPQCRASAQHKTLKCEWCKKPFTCENHRNRLFCSRECFHAADKGAKHAEMPGHEKHYKDCVICGKNFRVTKTRKDTAKYCSNSCKLKCPDFRYKKSASVRAEKNHRWTGGLYKTGTGYIREKKKILGTETFTFNHRTVMLNAMLKECPNHPFLITNLDGEIKLSSSIEVHHIDRNRSNNEISNLLAVTKLAHAKIHHHNRKPEPWECWPSDPTIW